MLDAKRLKTCACGMVYFDPPKNSKYAPDAIAPGYYFNCKCNSTLVWPDDQKESRIEKISVATYSFCFGLMIVLGIWQLIAIVWKYL